MANPSVAARFGRALTLSLAVSVVAPPLLAQARLMRDIDTRPRFGSLPRDFVVLRDLLYFFAKDTNGYRLWRSSLTHTNAIASVHLPVGGSEMVVAGSRLFFRAQDATRGVELWSSQGSFPTTRVVRDIAPGTRSGDPRELTAVGSRLFFTAETSAGRELWISDGSASGTRMVKDLMPGSRSSDPRDLIEFRGKLLFTAAGTHSGVPQGRELWISDGTAAGTRMYVSLVHGAAHIDPRGLVKASNTVYFTAFASSIGAARRLWRTNGTASGTVRVSGADIRGPLHSVGTSTIYFAAGNTQTGLELWQSRGTSSTTRLLKDIFVGPISSQPTDFVRLGSDVFFTAKSKDKGRELWRIRSSGVTMITDLLPGSLDGVPLATTTRPNLFSDPASQRIVFRGRSRADNTELWSYDGKSSRPQLVQDIAPNGASTPYSFASYAGHVVFVASDGVTGPEPWSIELDALHGKFAPFGRGCRGTGPRVLVCGQNNGNGGDLSHPGISVQRTYAIEVPAIPQDRIVLGYELFTERIAHSGAIRAALHLADANGRPEVNPVRTRLPTIGTTPEWNRITFKEAITIPAGKKFFVTVDARIARQPTVKVGSKALSYMRPTNATTWTPMPPVRWAYRVICASGRGTPRITYDAFLPRIGWPTRVLVRDAKEKGAAVLFLGFSSDRWGALRLPFSLSAIGAPGCTLLSSAEIMLPGQTDLAGVGSRMIFWPDDRGLLGHSLYGQWVSIDGAANSLGVALSNATRMVIGRP